MNDTAPADPKREKLVRSIAEYFGSLVVTQAADQVASHLTDDDDLAADIANAMQNLFAHPPVPPFAAAKKLGIRL